MLDLTKQLKIEHSYKSTLNIMYGKDVFIIRESLIYVTVKRHPIIMWDYIFTTPSEVMATIASTDAVLSHLHKGSMGYILIFSILFLRN